LTLNGYDSTEGDETIVVRPAQDILMSGTKRQEREERDIARLNSRKTRAQCASILLGLFGLLCICLYLQPGLIGAPLGQHESYGGRLIWLLAGVSIIVLACYLYTTTTQWVRRLLWIRENVAPSPMTLTLEAVEGSEGTHFYAFLVVVEPRASAQRSRWRMGLWAKPPDIGNYVHKALFAKVYFDPESGRPAVVDFEHGILWSIAGRESTERLGEEENEEIEPAP
jgi:hypothetical protein